MKKSTTSQRLKQIMEERGLRQIDILKKCEPYCKSSGVKIRKNDLSQYVSGKVVPKQDKLSILALALGVTEIWLMGYDDEKEITYETNNNFIALTSDEQDIILKYKGLDDSGKLFIKKAIDHESDRMAEKIEQKITNNRIYAYYNKIAAAGSGFYFDDIPADTIEAPYYPNADFIIGVCGDSMEPDFFDGENVYVRRTQNIPIGTVGIFTINNECFIKERGADGLISRNQKYDIINGNEDVRAVGEVLGKVENGRRKK